VNRHLLIGVAAGLAVGLLIGYQVGRAGRVLKGPEPVVAAALPAAAPQGASAMPPPAAPQGAPAAAPIDAAAQIATAQGVVERDPKNVRAWVALGNLYFDTHQHQKSVDAYARALELEPDSPDVLTDQGVMYRALGAYDKAVANFEKASRLAPQHLQSLFNLGVVYAFDLKDRARAEAAWNKILQIAPTSEHAAQARQALADLQGQR
jgi:cytochrome c-type biogenesis protein CcmH/NrfG